jgi:hypothetical protein
MKLSFTRIAAVLAFIVGALAVIAGGQVLLGRNPGYRVIGWLPLYNFIMGILTVTVTSLLLWRGSKFALPVVLATLAANILVLIILQVAYGDAVAAASLGAMGFRVVVWLAIAGLLLAQRRQDRRWGST